MFEQAEIEYINEIAASSDASKYAKTTLKALYRIYDKYTGNKTTNCFCSSTVRKIYYKDFINWYESNT
jgi:preprotein translocase subunit SecA